jgi:hypothetical protein
MKLTSWMRSQFLAPAAFNPDVRAIVMKSGNLNFLEPSGPLQDFTFLLVLFSDAFIISYNKTLAGSFMNKELEWAWHIPRTLGFSWNKENQRTAFKVADRRDRDLNLEPAENKRAGATTDRPSTPFRDAAKSLSSKKKIHLVGLYLTVRCYRNINL